MTRNNGMDITTAQKKKCQEALQNFNETYLCEESIEGHRSEMEGGKLKYTRRDLETATKRLYTISIMLPLFSLEATKFSGKEMAHKIIPQNLGTNARIEYITQGGKKLQDKADVIALCRRLQKVAGLRTEGKHEQKMVRTANKSKNAGQSSNKTDQAICCIHGNYKLSRRPNNKVNKDKMGVPTKAKAAKRGEAVSTEAQQSSKNKAPTVHFDSEEKESTTSSDGELVSEVMEVFADAASKAVHFITKITFPKKGNWRMSCRALLDQCCTDKGLISHDLTHVLGLSGEKSQRRLFLTTAETFTTCCIIQIDDLMFPSL